MVEVVAVVAVDTEEEEEEEEEEVEEDPATVHIRMAEGVARVGPFKTLVTFLRTINPKFVLKLSSGVVEMK
jgi:hypothetical protein